MQRLNPPNSKKSVAETPEVLPTPEVLKIAERKKCTDAHRNFPEVRSLPAR